MANAFNYPKVTEIMNNMQLTADAINQLLSGDGNGGRGFIALINDNVDNPNIWQGKSSAEFKKAWENFSEENFPKYKEAFSKKIQDVDVSLKEWQASEQA